MQSSVEELRRQLSRLTEAEATAALNAIAAYRKKRDRAPGQALGRFDEFMASLDVGQCFSARDVVGAGVSTSRAYERITRALEAQEIELVEAGRAGRACQPAIYRKLGT